MVPLDLLDLFVYYCSMKNLLIAVALMGSISLASCGGSNGTPSATDSAKVSVSKDTTKITATVDSTKKDSVIKK